jgi:flagellar operon protein
MSQISGMGQVTQLPQADQKQKTDKSGGPSFQDILKEKTGEVQLDKAVDSLKFSAHAAERIASRGIKLMPDDISKMNAAIDKAGQKGSKDTLLLMGDNAFIVNVKNRTVVTAMDRSMMKENVFTNIDSTIVL